ncbi:MAG TPA: hypothetical protein VGH50_05000 [Candidatus Binatia bacterium]
MSPASLIIAGAGALASAVATRYAAKDPRHAWMLGLAGIFPAWLIAFLTLIDPASRSAVDVPLPPRALLSSGAGLLGVIATDYWLRKTASKPPVFLGWLIGWIALVPAWLIAAVG